MSTPFLKDLLPTVRRLFLSLLFYIFKQFFKHFFLKKISNSISEQHFAISYKNCLQSALHWFSFKSSIKHFWSLLSFITSKIQDAGPKHWWKLQTAAIAGSANSVRILAKILSESPDPFAYSPPLKDKINR